MEEPIIRGIAHDDSGAKLTVHGVPDQPGIAAAVFEPMATAGVNVDMIVQNVSSQGVTDISFTVPANVADEAVEIAERVAGEIGASGVDLDRDISKITVVGAGMKSESGVAAEMFGILSASDVNIEMISTSTIRISCIIRGEDTQTAIAALHRELIGERS